MGILKKKETAFRKLDRVAGIKSREDRTTALRALLAEDNVIARVVQICYHPDVKWKLPDGELPETIANKSNHDDYAPFYQSVKKFYMFRDNFNMIQHQREANFLSIFEAVSNDDSILLIGIKDKKLPWRNLGADFVMEAVPELFPPVETKENT